MAMIIKGTDPVNKENRGITSSEIDGTPDRQALDVNPVGGATAANQNTILNAMNNLELTGTLTEKRIKAGYDESDIVDNKITINEALGNMTGLIARNNSTTNTLTLTINSISVILATKGVDANNIPNDYKFYGGFDPFSEIEVAGTSPDFDIYVEG